MKLYFCFLFLLISYSVSQAQLFVDEADREIHGMNPMLASKNRIHSQSFCRLLPNKNGADTSLVWRKEYNQDGFLIAYYRPPINMKEEMYKWEYDTTGRLSYASKKRDSILEYEKFYSHEYHNDTLMVELIKFVGKPVYTTKYYYCPSNKLLYKTGLDTIGQKQRMDYFFNDDGLLEEVISTAYGNSVKLLDYQYDGLGNPVKIISYHWTDKIDYIEYNKYENNNCIERNQIASCNNKSRYKEVNSYDKNYNLIEQIVYTYDKFFSHTKYYYNSENLIIRQESYDKKNRLKSTTIYTYENWP